MSSVIVFYDITLFNLSLFNNRNDLLKEAFFYLVNVIGKLIIILEIINYAL